MSISRNEWLHRLAQTTIASVVFLGCSGRTASAPSSHLVLEERHAWDIDNPSVISGGEILSGNSVVVSTKTGNLLLFQLNRPAAQELVSLGTPLLLGTPNGTAAVKQVVVGGTDSTIFELKADGSLTSLGRCPGAVAAVAVMPIGDGILAVYSDNPILPGAGGFSTGLIAVSDGKCDMGPRVSLPCVGRGYPTIAPASDGTGVVACGDSINGLLRITAEGMQARVAMLLQSAPAVIQPQGTSEEVPLWFGLPLLRLDSGFLEVFADLRGNRRRFELWDDRGRHVRTRFLDAPLGIVASSVENRSMLGMRTGNDFELVLFKWSWASENGQ